MGTISPTTTALRSVKNGFSLLFARPEKLNRRALPKASSRRVEKYSLQVRLVTRDTMVGMAVVS